MLGLAPAFCLHSARGEQPAPAEHKHEDGSACTADHGHDDHQHKAGETCTQGHAHEEHRHADGAVCTGDHELEGHQHAEGEACTGDHEREESAEKNSSQPGDMIPVHVDEKARHSLDMRFEKVEETSHGAAKTLHGQMVIPPHAVTTYALPAAGRVTFNVKSAQQVRKGNCCTRWHPRILWKWKETPPRPGPRWTVPQQNSEPSGNAGPSWKNRHPQQRTEYFHPIQRGGNPQPPGCPERQQQ